MSACGTEDAAWSTWNEKQPVMLATFLSISFCLLSLFFFSEQHVPGLIWFVSCDHDGWTRREDQLIM